MHDYMMLTWRKSMY